MTDVRLLLMTAPTADVAESIIAALLAEALIACGNITMPVTSLYRWRGETERASEVLVIIKTTAAAVAAARQRIVEMHPYEVPEVLTLPVLDGFEPYLSWVRTEVTSR